MNTSSGASRAEQQGVWLVRLVTVSLTTKAGHGCCAGYASWESVSLFTCGSSVPVPLKSDEVSDEVTPELSIDVAAPPSSPCVASRPPTPALASTARQVMGNNLDGTGGINISATNQSYVAFRIPGAVYAPRQHALLVYAEARKYSQDDWGGQHDLTLRRSLNDGASFGPLLTVVNAAEVWPERCPSPTHNCSAIWDPSAVVDKMSGRITIFFSRTQSVWGISSHRDSLWIVRTDDGGVTFTKPVDVSSCHRYSQIGHPYPHRTIACTTPGGGHGIQTTKGRLIVPLYSESVTLGSGVCLSDDGGRSWHFGAHPVMPAGHIGALGALEPEVAELFDENARPPPVEPAPGSQCQVKLNEWCNNRTANKDCIDSTLPAHPDAAPFVALFGLGSGDHGAREWRCYSHLALDKMQRNWDSNSSLPHAYCTHPKAADGSNALADIRDGCAPPQLPPQNASTTLMLTLRRAFGSDGAPTVWCGNGVQNCRAHALSSDNGESWTGYAIQPNLPDPGVKAGLFRFEPPLGSKSYAILAHLASMNASVSLATPGALLFVNPAPKLGSNWQDRIRTTLRMSLDNGRSWPFAVQIDARSGYSTIASTSDPDTVAVIFEDTYGSSTSRPFPAACSRFPSPKAICDGGVLLSRVNIGELLSQGAWAAPVAQPCTCKSDDLDNTHYGITRTPMPNFTWESLSTFCFPGGYHPSPSCHADYTAADLIDYSRFSLVLVQGQNFTRYANGSWRATQQAETAKFAAAMNRPLVPPPPPLPPRQCQGVKLQEHWNFRGPGSAHYNFAPKSSSAAELNAACCGICSNLTWCVFFSTNRGGPGGGPACHLSNNASGTTIQPINPTTDDCWLGTMAPSAPPPPPPPPVLSATPRKIYPYIGFYAPAAWYEAQARFNDPEQHWKEMWLRDSQARYGSMTAGGGAGSVSCSSSTEEKGDFTQ